MPPRPDDVRRKHLTVNCARQALMSLRYAARRQRVPLSTLVVRGFRAYIDGWTPSGAAPPAGGLASLSIYVDPDLAGLVRAKLVEAGRSMAWLLHHIPALTGDEPSSLVAVVLPDESPLASLLPASNPKVSGILEAAIRVSGGNPQAVQRGIEAGLARMAALGCDPRSLRPTERALAACLLSPGTLPAHVDVTPSGSDAIGEAVYNLELMLDFRQEPWGVTDFAPLALFFTALVRLPVGVLRALPAAMLDSFYPVAVSAVRTLSTLVQAVPGALDQRTHPEARAKALRDRRALADGIVDTLCESARRITVELRP